jgi:hypothetical protein
MSVIAFTRWTSVRCNLSSHIVLRHISPSLDGAVARQIRLRFALGVVFLFRKVNTGAKRRCFFSTLSTAF